MSMSKAVAVELEITWNPDITVQMQSANRTLEQMLGLSKNVPFLFGHITVYLQVHVIEKPAYKVLLGRPNTGERCVMHTHEWVKLPTVLKKPVKEDFLNPSMN